MNWTRSVRETLFPAAGLCACLLVSLAATQARAEVLLEEAFDGVADGGKPPANRSSGTLSCWEGNSERELGTIAVTSRQPGNSSGKSLSITRATAETTRAPVLEARWTAPNRGAISVQWKFMTPCEDLTSLSFIGGIWPDAAAIFIVEGGKFWVQDAGGDGARAQVAGSYKPNQWYRARIDLDVSRRTFDFYLDGRRVLNGRRFQPGNKAVGLFHLTGDLSKAKRDPSAPVLYVDDVLVTSASALQDPPATQIAK